MEEKIREDRKFAPFVITLGQGSGKDCEIIVDGKPLSYVRSFKLRADVHDLVSLHIERYMIQEKTEKIEGSGMIQKRVVFGVFSKDMIENNKEKILQYNADIMGDQWKRNYVVSEKEARRLYENLKEIFG